MRIPDVVTGPGASQGGHTSTWFFFLFGAVAIVVGVFQTARPDLAFRMQQFGSGWMYKNSAASKEPSHAGLLWIRFGSLVFVGVGIAMLVVGATR